MIGPTSELDREIARNPHGDSGASLSIGKVSISLLASYQEWQRSDDCAHAVVVITIDRACYDVLGALPDYRWLHGEHLMRNVGLGKTNENLNLCVICGPVPKMAVGFREIMEVSGA